MFVISCIFGCKKWFQGNCLFIKNVLLVHVYEIALCAEHQYSCLNVLHILFCHFAGGRCSKRYTFLCWRTSTVAESARLIE